ncbi:thioredoxin domain-containing protein [Magnetospirillum moscoviense]|uniref:Thymidylate kinase n=1 Tax=Magnetospirillum moscoviense TaxID=1437059 RepID=A0A178MTZ1_9PROT|nr:thioredoxin domain-containing protein [Magnetospirillum moscoviense]OAN53108.1 thymidylate kinase [Magnetospirillum moscoviense]
MTNRLAGETSPYLLQHQDNPVDWWPWGPEALAEAKAQGKPILLSIGYAACHWCHVMAHESFEDPTIAEQVNRDFIAIKIDREERPDLDSIYQQALGLMGQHGGWPLTMFCTPAAEPFWGGTYFPPTPRWGRPSFPEVLGAVSRSWDLTQERVFENVATLKAGLARAAHSPGPGTLSLDLLDRSARAILRMVDTEHGGIGGAPKFPQPGLFDFLWRSARRTGDSAMKNAVLLTLDRICQGGIYDHLGGGFMRYSTDDIWLVPHFEKMLYDNAQLVSLLTLLWQETGDPLWRDRVAETIGWLLAEMLAEGDAFAATLDADSEGHEGRFYVWQAAEIDSLLDAETNRWFRQAYGITQHGNWEGTTILNRSGPQPEGAEDLLARARPILKAARDQRVWPGRDDKVLADWNGLMIAALAEAAFVFDQPGWLDAARRAFETVRTRMALPGDRLAHSLRLDRLSDVGLLDDLATMGLAALALYQTTGESPYLREAAAWAEAAQTHHWDQSDGGFFQTATDARDLMVRPKPVHDSAVPSANGLMAQLLAKLWLLTGETRWRDRADATIAAFSGLDIDHHPNITALLTAFDLLADSVQVVITEGAGAHALERAVAAIALPNRILLRTGGTDPLPDHHPAFGKLPIDGRAAAYVCRGSTCSAPITDPAALRAALASR